MKYFTEGLTKEELHKEYKTLVKKYHPDRNPGADAHSIMSEINKEYDEYFVSIQKKNFGFDWEDLSTRYTEARKSRETTLRFMSFDKQRGSGWFTLQKEYSPFYGSTTVKYVSDGSESWDNFHGGFALTQELTPAFGEVNHSLRRVPAKIECPSVQDMYFGSLGVSRTEALQAGEQTMESAYVSMFGRYRIVRTEKRGDIWVNDDGNAFVKIDGLVMSTPIPKHLLKNSLTLAEYKGTDLGYKAFQDCTEAEFRQFHDVQYVPQYSESLNCKKLKDNELWWIDDPIVAHFARIRVLNFYESGENFRQRYGTFSNIGLAAHLHELSIEDAEHIQDFLDELNSEFENYIKCLIKRGKIRVAI